MEKSKCRNNSQKKDTWCIKNYKPFSLLPIRSKIFERIIYSTMFTYFIENNLISQNQSGFKPGDFSVNILLAITHEIFSRFDENYEARGVFLNISKAFYKVWDEGLIHKFKRNGISTRPIPMLVLLKCGPYT